MGNRAQELGRVTFFLQREVAGRLTDEFERAGMDFPGLAFPLRFDQLTSDADGGTGAHFVNVIIAWDSSVCDTLEVPEARPIIELDEGKLFGVAAGPHPSFDCD